MTTQQTTTIQELVKANRITLSAQLADRNPHMEDRDMDHWKCRLRHGSKTMTVYFSKGYGHHGAKPTVDEVLDCLASDACGLENARSFEDWAGDYGYDPDSRKAEKTYRTIEKQAARLQEVLGEDLYETLLWNTERL